MKKFDSVPEEYEVLVTAADMASRTAYNPYSGFSVGAALRSLIDDLVITGSNVENAAYGSSICAERAAILRANAIGRRWFTAIAIIGRGRDFDCPEVVAPCGACRQVICEMGQIIGYDIDVVMSNSAQTKVIVAKISELLPLAFGPKDLGIDLRQFLPDHIKAALKHD